MSMTFIHSGSFSNTESFLKSVSKLDIPGILQSCARDGVNALARATPVDSRLASSSWGYEVSSSGGGCTISWTNSDVENGFPVAIMLQYGYGTGTGGYVQGRDYINPAMKPVFDMIADKVWKAVTSA
jgi:hypothetical protein